MSAVIRVVEGRPRDLGGFSVRRVLPAGGLQTVGPFIFFDHMGPAVFAPESGVDVRPHPHIGLATVTYLYAGEFMHRDSLGTAQLIRPGDVNWMVAGRGIAHSERTPPEVRLAGGASIHGIQTWIALPRQHEETEPAFEHHASKTLPEIRLPGALLRLIAGTAFGQQAPASVFSPMFYLDATLEVDATVGLPAQYEERAVYVTEGEIEVEGSRYGPGQMVVFAAGATAAVLATTRSRAMLLGGAPLDGPRYIWWNFVSSSRERIEQAKRDWQRGGFAGARRRRTHCTACAVTHAQRMSLPQPR